jgi:XapX domain-containing protein
MTQYVVSLLMGVAVGVAYGLVQVRSPAPPLIALVGLLGMVLGEQAGIMGRHYFAPTSESVRQVGAVEHSLRAVRENTPEVAESPAYDGKVPVAGNKSTPSRRS